VAGQGLVDRVVDDLPDQVVQAALAGGPDVHARALADRLEPLEHLDRGRVVVAPDDRAARTTHYPVEVIDDLIDVVGGGRLLRHARPLCTSSGPARAGRAKVTRHEDERARDPTLMIPPEGPRST